MKNFFKNIFKNIKENRFVWKRRSSFVYAIGVWTIVGVGVMTIANPRDIFQSINKPFQTALTPADEEEQKMQEAIRRNESKIRSESCAIHVADNIYTPFEFMA